MCRVVREAPTLEFHTHHPYKQYVLAYYGLDVPDDASPGFIYTGTVYVSIGVNAALFVCELGGGGQGGRCETPVFANLTLAQTASCGDASEPTSYVTPPLLLSPHTPPDILLLVIDMDDPFEYSLASLSPAMPKTVDADSVTLGALSSAVGETDEINPFPLLEVYARLAAYAHAPPSGGGVDAAHAVTATAASLAHALVRRASCRPGGLVGFDDNEDRGSTNVDERRAYRKRLAASMRALLNSEGGSDSSRSGPGSSALADRYVPAWSPQRQTL